MISRAVPLIFMSTTLLLLTAGCQNKTEDPSDQKTLSKTEAANLNQVTLEVTGMG